MRMVLCGVQTSFSVACAALLVLWLSSSVRMGAAELGCKEPLKCYNCSSAENGFCADPFNRTQAAFDTLIECKDMCLKWERQVEIGKDTDYKGYYIERRCASFVNRYLYIGANTCVQESRPGHGHLCLCDKDGCNSSLSILSHGLLLITSTLVSVVLFVLRSL